MLTQIINNYALEKYKFCWTSSLFIQETIYSIEIQSPGDRAILEDTLYFDSSIIKTLFNINFELNKPNFKPIKLKFKFKCFPTKCNFPKDFPIHFCG